MKTWSGERFARSLCHISWQLKRRHFALTVVAIFWKPQTLTQIKKKIITGDECWYFMYNLQSTRQTSVQLSPTAQRPQKVCQQKSRIKTMLIVFFDSKGVIHHLKLTCQLCVLPWGHQTSGFPYCRVCPEYSNSGSWSLRPHSANILQ